MVSQVQSWAWQTLSIIVLHVAYGVMWAPRRPCARLPEFTSWTNWMHSPSFILFTASILVHDWLCITVSWSQLDTCMIDWKVSSDPPFFFLQTVRWCACVCVCVYQTINVSSLTSDPGCWGMLLSCQTDCCTHTHRPVSHIHTHTEAVCVPKLKGRHVRHSEMPEYLFR